MKHYRAYILIAIIGAFIGLLSLPSSAQAENQTAKLESLTTNLDASCQTDDDCAKKNVGNCCGYYPGCVNKNTETHPEMVSKICAERGLAGICGFPDFETCQCVEGTCKPHTNPAQFE